MRSKTSQRQAGGVDRRATDDGGHFIAARFDGPTDSFNHFAQDANFNRGGYRAIEDGWAKELRAGHRVSVDITAHYPGSSRRPDRIAVTWSVDAINAAINSLTSRGGMNMVADKFDLLGPALGRVGEEIMRIVGGEPDRIYLYVEIGDNWVQPSVFKDEGDQVKYIDDDGWDLSTAIMDAWRLEPKDKRWSGMEYAIDDGKFNATFQFDDLTAYDGSIDRSERFLRARYGSKPIIYPPWKGSVELKRSS